MDDLAAGNRKRVVVVGGGVAGSLVAKTLQDQSNVFLIDSKEYFEITWASLRSMVEPSFAKRTVISHSEYLHNANIITSPATGITGNEVVTAQGRSIGYDYLVIATGHVDNRALTKPEQLHRYQAEHDKIKAADSILIVGGGPSGVELAAEITVDFPGKKVTLVHRGSRLLEFIGEKAGRKALDWLNSKKVEVILGQSVDLNSEDGVYRTSEGETIAADIHFLCTGAPIGSSWLKKTCLEDSLDAQGRLMVDANLRVKGHTKIFAIGDITDVPELKQGYSAQAHALVAAKNLALLIKGESDCSKLSVYKPASPMALVSLGRREGVAQLPCITIGGRIPGMLKSGDLFVGKTRKQLGLNASLP